MQYVGWYHSHPRIAPFPSQIDLNMQMETQTQVPYGVGLICSSWFPPTTGIRGVTKSSSMHSCYLNAFRVEDDPEGLKAVKIPWHVGLQPHLQPSAQVSMGKVLEVQMTEAKETREWLMKEAKGPMAKEFLNTEFEAFQTDVLREDHLQVKMGVLQDIDNVVQENQFLRKELLGLQQEAIEKNIDVEAILADTEKDDLACCECHEAASSERLDATPAPNTVCDCHPTALWFNRPIRKQKVTPKVTREEVGVTEERVMREGRVTRQRKRVREEEQGSEEGGEEGIDRIHVDNSDSDDGEEKSHKRTKSVHDKELFTVVTKNKPSLSPAKDKYRTGRELSSANKVHSKDTSKSGIQTKLTHVQYGMTKKGATDSAEDDLAELTNLEENRQEMMNSLGEEVH